MVLNADIDEYNDGRSKGGGLCPTCKIQRGDYVLVEKFSGGDYVLVVKFMGGNFVHVYKNEQGGFCPGGIMSVSRSYQI